LLAVESSADTELLTSILLLDGKQLWHGAAPSLPKSYCVQSTARKSAQTPGLAGRRPISAMPFTSRTSRRTRFGRTIGTLRGAWAPRLLVNANSQRRRVLIGTFAIYHLTPRSPTRTKLSHKNDHRPCGSSDHVVSRAECGRGSTQARQRQRPRISDAWDSFDDAQAFQTRLQAYAAEFDRYAAMVESRELSNALKAVAEDCRNLLGIFHQT